MSNAVCFIVFIKMKTNVSDRQINVDSLTEVLKVSAQKHDPVSDPLWVTDDPPPPSSSFTDTQWMPRLCQTCRFPPRLPLIQLDDCLHTPVHTNKFLLSAASEGDKSGTAIDPVSHVCHVSEDLKMGFKHLKNNDDKI